MVFFASSIGRSGTCYLANLFSHCTDVPAEHAAEPLCHDQVMVDVNNGIPREEVTRKAQIIEATVAEQGAYFESTQIFIRVLAESFLEFFPAISVIHLLRDPMEVACSYVNRKSYPSHPDRPWRLPLNLKHSLFEFPQSLTPMQENLCDWLENELRYLRLVMKFEKTAEFRFSNFGSAEHVCKLFEDLEVPYREADVIFHTTKQDLDRNANRRKTRISRKNLRQSRDLVGLLNESGFPCSLFRQDYYQDFDFTRWIAES